LILTVVLLLIQFVNYQKYDKEEDVRVTKPGPNDARVCFIFPSFFLILTFVLTSIVDTIQVVNYLNDDEEDMMV
jgi:hypothetical protein